MTRQHHWLCGFVGVLVLAGSAVASDPPDSAINPSSGNIEIADPVWAGTNQNVDFVIQISGQKPEIQTVTDNSLDDRRPRIAHASNGDAWVTWWRDDVTDAVLIRKRHLSDGSWDAERVLSDSQESSRSPTIVYDGTAAWVAYELDNQSNTDIAVSIVIDDPDPVGTRVVVATTDFTGTVAPKVHTEQGHLWVTWVDSASDVGWVEYDYASETWSLPAFESYAADTVADARDRIRDIVVGP